MSGEKTEKPTAKKLKEARAEGRVAMSPDVAAWAGMLVASFLIPMVVKNAMEAAGDILDALPDVMKHPEPADAINLLGKGLGDALMAVAPLGGGLLVAALAAGAVQTGMRPAMKKLKPKFSHLNPFAGIKRMVGGQALWEGAKAVIKTAVLGAVLYWQVDKLLPTLLASGSLQLSAIGSYVDDAIFGLLRAAAVAGLGMAGVDYMMARRRVGKQLRMSKQDVKEEYKRSEGDPHVKGQIRARQMAMSRNRMMADVPKADVILVNPTHVAVALRYEPSKGAPKVVAKGAGAIAAKIRELATENRIPMVQDIPLARTLYKSCEVGQEVPTELFGAIARVLAFVMTLKRKGSAAGLHRNVA
jgi:flagellar biosynthetic protein FlhB